MNEYTAIRYNVLLYDDDPLYLRELKRYIEETVRDSVTYTVVINVTSSTREVMRYASENYVDLFVLDLCRRIPTNDSYDYQGYELLKDLQTNYSKASEAKYIAISNLRKEVIRSAFGYSRADYFCKDEMNKPALASYIKGYFDTIYRAFENNARPMKTTRIPNSDSHICDKCEELSRKVISREFRLEKDQLDMIVSELELIKDQIMRTNPNKGVIKKALDCLKGIKECTEFMSAVASLVEFVNNFFGSK